jgi:tRNA threonylcarbamoyladenosine biosynthesis protein TsaE|tara:strand:+ start:1104 stop:1550 length:447 start_codon:yes stop_codon:yes gene_type:complete
MNISSPKDLNKITEKINKIISPGDYIFLFGEIGSGKTTFTRHLVNSLEIKNKLSESEVLSPTFNIVYEYEINNILIKHFDLYRLRSKDELNNLGIFDNTEDIITIIEWPELIDEKPLNRLELYFKYAENMEERNLEIYFYGRLKENKF